jgi:hypothetical protein
MTRTDTFAAAAVKVAGGKFHRLAEPNTPRAAAWKATRSACGRTITPQNYFDTVEEALAYCGGRSQFLCRQCGFKP